MPKKLECEVCRAKFSDDAARKWCPRCRQMITNLLVYGRSISFRFYEAVERERERLHRERK